MMTADIFSTQLVDGKVTLIRHTPNREVAFTHTFPLHIWNEMRGMFWVVGYRQTIEAYLCRIGYKRGVKTLVDQFCVYCLRLILSDEKARSSIYNPRNDDGFPEGFILPPDKF